MTRREDLIQFFICANSAQDRQDFDLDKFTNDYLERNPIINNDNCNHRYAFLVPEGRGAMQCSDCGEEI